MATASAQIGPMSSGATRVATGFPARVRSRKRSPLSSAHPVAGMAIQNKLTGTRVNLAMCFTSGFSSIDLAQINRIPSEGPENVDASLPPSGGNCNLCVRRAVSRHEDGYNPPGHQFAVRQRCRSNREVLGDTNRFGRNSHMRAQNQQHRQIIEKWMLAIVKDGGNARYHDLHIDEIDDKWRSRHLWIDGGLEAFQVAFCLRELHKLPFTLALAFALEMSNQLQTVELRTPDDLQRTTESVDATFALSL